MEWIFFILAQGVVLIGVYSYFRWRNKRDLGQTKRTIQKDDNRELCELRQMRMRALNLPLSELSRPRTLNDIVGQEDGIKALRAALCGPNPQHVLIYGPPGVGKTCAARLILDEAKKRTDSPFKPYSRFIEIDATCVRFDERAIADPLLGSVHDPIYQGAGSLGTQGVPQPKPGAVSNAHCGVLFLDEIGELHPVQMNKLLKVLEDRCVKFESAYYSRHNQCIPSHIHDIFQNGIPADFRLIGATTRSPEDIPSALRSRCVEIFFAPLNDAHLTDIAQKASQGLRINVNRAVLSECAAYSRSGRDAVNIIQLAGSAAHNEGRNELTKNDIEWVAATCHYCKKPHYSLKGKASVGTANGLGVSGSIGSVIEIECSVQRSLNSNGSLTLRGAIDEEEFDMRGKKLKRRSMAIASAENVTAAFRRVFGIDCRKYDIAFNIPGGQPMDGPSAGVALSVALMSALSGRKPRMGVALTGEVTVSGEVRPVGGIREKLEAAREADATLVIIPSANSSEADTKGITILPVKNLSEVMKHSFETISANNDEDKQSQITLRHETVAANAAKSQTI